MGNMTQDEDDVMNNNKREICKTHLPDGSKGPVVTWPVYDVNAHKTLPAEPGFKCTRRECEVNNNRKNSCLTGRTTYKTTCIGGNSKTKYSRPAKGTTTEMHRNENKGSSSQALCKNDMFCVHTAHGLLQQCGRCARVMRWCVSVRGHRQSNQPCEHKPGRGGVSEAGRFIWLSGL